MNGNWEPGRAGRLCCYIGYLRVLQFRCDAGYSGPVEITLDMENNGVDHYASAIFTCN